MNSVGASDTSTDSRVERYAAGRMSEQEELEFETQMLQSPTLAAQVQAELGMRVGLRRLQAAGEVESPALRGQQRRARMQYTLAAGVLLCLIGSVAWLAYRGTQRSAPNLVAVSVAGLHTDHGTDIAPLTFILAHTRSTVETPTLQIPASGQPLALQIYPESSIQFQAYTVHLDRLMESGDRRALGELIVKAAADGSVRIYLDSTRLTPGKYGISLLRPAHQEHFALQLTVAHPPAK